MIYQLISTKKLTVTEEMKEGKKEKDWPDNIGEVQVFEHRDAI